MAELDMVFCFHDLQHFILLTVLPLHAFAINSNKGAYSNQIKSNLFANTKYERKKQKTRSKAKCEKQ